MPRNLVSKIKDRTQKQSIYFILETYPPSKSIFYDYWGQWWNCSSERRLQRILESSIRVLTLPKNILLLILIFKRTYKINVWLCIKVFTYSYNRFWYSTNATLILEYKSELEDGIDKYKNLRSWGNIEEKTGQELILFGTLQVGKNNERKQKKQQNSCVNCYI